MNCSTDSNLRQKSGSTGFFLPQLCWGAGLLLAGWMLAGCVSDPPRYPDVDAPPPTANAGTNSATVTGTNNMEGLDDSYKLAIGDQLSFRIVEEKADVRQLEVTDSGELEVPYLGRVPAEGKTCKALAGELKRGLEKEYYRHATVILAVNSMTKSRGKIYLSGPVRAAGPQEIPSDEVLTLSKAILRAGGFGDFADTRKVKVTRRSRPGQPEQTFTVNVGLILEKGRNDLDLTLEPGDMIYIPERTIRF